MASYQILKICIKLTREVGFGFMALYFIVKHLTEPKCVRVCAFVCVGVLGGGGWVKSCSLVIWWPIWFDLLNAAPSTPSPLPPLPN